MLYNMKLIMQAPVEVLMKHSSDILRISIYKNIEAD